MAVAIIIASAYGSITSNNQGSWGGAQGATTGTIQSVNTQQDIEVYAISGGRGNTYRVSRFFMWFDTSPYPNITAVEYYFPSGGQQGNEEYIIDESTAFGGSGGSPLVGNDFNNIQFGQATTGPFQWGNPGIFQVSGGAYAVTLANTGVLNNVVLNFPYDDQNNPPAIGAGGFITWADVVPGEPIDVYIEITYTPTPTGWTGGSSINGVALADLGSMNGIPFTDIASINGI
jgi:hypothetical protein